VFTTVLNTIAINVTMRSVQQQPLGVQLVYALLHLPYMANNQIINFAQL